MMNKKPYKSIVSEILSELFILSDRSLPIQNLHYLCRTADNDYPVPYYCSKTCESKQDDKNIIRPLVPDNFVDWSTYWPEYEPKEYTSKHLLSNPKWADSQDVSGIKFNEIDGEINRKSYVKAYIIDHNTGRPLNPIGRTGITGRGRLGKWGPNHAADAIISRWKRDEDGIICRHPETGKKIFEFFGIHSLDTQQWVIPGGMCDNPEDIKDTVKREFFEEKSESSEKLLNEFFNNGAIVYQGYVDDPRNTDNAWVETTAYNFHDDDDKIILKHFKSHASSEAEYVRWIEVDKNLQLHSSNKEFIAKIAQIRDGHFSSDENQMY